MHPITYVIAEKQPPHSWSPTHLEALQLATTARQPAKDCRPLPTAEWPGLDEVRRFRGKKV